MTIVFAVSAAALAFMRSRVRRGAITTGISLMVYLAIGTPWLLAVAR